MKDSAGCISRENSLFPASAAIGSNSLPKLIAEAGTAAGN
jgi:hypothetical protein